MVQGVSARRNSVRKRRNAGIFPTSAGKARTDEPKNSFKNIHIDNSLFNRLAHTWLTAGKAKSENDS